MKVAIGCILVTVGFALRRLPVLLPERRGMAYPKLPWYYTTLKNKSMEQAGVTCDDVSVYGAVVPKMPQSHVEQISELKAKYKTKAYNMNFQGGITMPRRHWVVTFAKEHFADHDMYVANDAPLPYTPAGPYDHTLEHRNTTFRPMSHIGNMKTSFDPKYYSYMVQSNFTLCPGGLQPWSGRFYESIMAGSIPVINSEETDFNEEIYGNSDPVPQWLTHIGYKYLTTAQLVSKTFSSTELKKIADDNYNLFEKYQTWIHGDRVPPYYAKLGYKKKCRSNKLCNEGCNHVGFP